MPNHQLGLDLSFSSTTAQWWRNRYAEGYRVMSQCLWTGGLAGFDGIKAVAERNLRFAREARFERSGYLNAAPPDWWADNIAISRARECAGAEWDGVKVMPVDWEIEGTPFWRCEALAGALVAAGKNADILYTRASIIGPTATRSFKGLWLAQFDENSDLASTRLTYGQSNPIGPYGSVAGKQWRNTHTVEGVSIDADTFDLDFWGQEDDMTPEQERKLEVAYNDTRTLSEQVKHARELAVKTAEDFEEFKAAEAKVNAGIYGAVVEVVKALPGGDSNLATKVEALEKRVGDAAKVLSGD